MPVQKMFVIRQIQGISVTSPRCGKIGAFGAPNAGVQFVMNIWGYSEESLVDLAVANPSALQQLHSLLLKMEQSASRDNLSTSMGCMPPMQCEPAQEGWVTLA